MKFNKYFSTANKPTFCAKTVLSILPSGHIMGMTVGDDDGLGPAPRSGVRARGGAFVWTTTNGMRRAVLLSPTTSPIEQPGLVSSSGQRRRQQRPRRPSAAIEGMASGNACALMTRSVC